MRVSRSLWKYADCEGAPIISAEGVYLCHFDPTFPLEMGFEIHDSRHLVRMNRHDSFEVIYVYDGRGFVQVRQRRFPISKGNLVVVGPNVYHQIVCHPGTKLKLHFLHFQSGILRGSASGEEEQYLAPFFCQDANFPNVVSLSSGLPDQVLEVMAKIYEELPASTDTARLAVRTYLRVLLLLLLRYYSQHVGTQKALEHRQQEVKRLDSLFRFIDQNYGQTIRTATAARLCAMSKAQFMKFFKRVTGQSFHTYLKHLRVAMAQALLTGGDKSIAEISILLGFCSQSHFGTTFTGIVGMPPHLYRRSFGKTRESNDGNELMVTRHDDRRPETEQGRRHPTGGLKAEPTSPTPPIFIGR